MSAIRIIATHSLRILFKDKSALIWMVLMPLLYIFVFGNAFRAESDPSRTRAYLAVYNQDDGYLSQRLFRSLVSENLQIDTLQSMPAKPPLRLLTIPDSFTVRLLKGQSVRLTLTIQADANVAGGMAAEIGIRRAYFRLLADLAELGVTGDSLSLANLQKLDGRTPLIRVNKEYAGRYKKIPSGFYHQIPANVVMFTMLVLFLYAGHSLVEEKKFGLLRRMRIAPVSMTQIYLGKLVGVTLVGLVQVFILLFFGRFLFAVHYGNAPLALLLLVFAFTVAIASIAISLGMAIRNEEKMTGIAIILALALSALSGCWFPLEIAPHWMNVFANFLPSGLAMKGFHAIISYGYGLSAILPYLTGLSLYAAFFIYLSHRYLQKFAEGSLHPTKGA